MLVVLNNKSNLEKHEFDAYIKELNKIENTNEIVLCPSDIYLNNIKLNRIKLGSQNVSSYDDGAHTGSVSAKQLKDLGVVYSLVGHSERRKENHETNEDINNKIKLLNEEGIIPILCVGEKEEEKEIRKEVIKKQIEEALSGNNTENIVIAYEPVWAIGTGIIPSTRDINDTILYIKEMYPNNRVLYGGSLNNNNIRDIKQIEILDGYLLGTVSIEIDKLNELLNQI